jgi:hypothetical protein
MAVEAGRRSHRRDEWQTLEQEHHRHLAVVDREALVDDPRRAGAALTGGVKHEVDNLAVDGEALVDEMWWVGALKGGAKHEAQTLCYKREHMRAESRNPHSR